MQYPVVLGNSGDEPDEAGTKSTKSQKYITSKIKHKKKQNAFARQAAATQATEVEGSQCLIPWVVAEVVGLLHAL
jgi:hypothetical protein